MYSNLNHSPQVTQGQAKIPKYLVSNPNSINKQQETRHYELNLVIEAISQTH